MHIAQEEIFKQFEYLHIAVIGDVMIDNYYWGRVDRISPEAPVPVVDIYRKESRLGGAANVALNCAALGAKVSLLSVTGNDPEGQLLCNMLDENHISPRLVRSSPQRITTSKTRILSRNQQMMRLDTELTEDLQLQDEHAFIDTTLRFLQTEKPDVLIFQDYNKGVLKENIIEKVLVHAKNLGILTAVDPKCKNFFTYRGVDIFKPNLHEVREGLKISLPEISLPALQEVHTLLHQSLQHHISFITLSEKGVFYQGAGHAALIPSHLRNIADVSGAGDTVIAVAAMVYALTRNAETMAAWSNIAGGLVCEELGVKPIDKNKLFAEIKRILPS